MRKDGRDRHVQTVHRQPANANAQARSNTEGLTPESSVASPSDVYMEDFQALSREELVDCLKRETRHTAARRGGDEGHEGEIREEGEYMV